MEHRDVLSRLSSLEAVAAELNSISDTASSFLRDLEERLIQLKIGVDVSIDDPLLPVTVDDEAIAEGREIVLAGQHHLQVPIVVLAFGRYGDRWRLLVRKKNRVYLFDEGEYDPCKVRGMLADPVLVEHVEYEDFYWAPISEKPLLDSSRDERLAAIKQIPLLLETIEEEARRRLIALHRGMDAVANPLEPAPTDDTPAKPVVRRSRTKTQPS